MQYERCFSSMKFLISNFNCFTCVWPHVVGYLERAYVINLLLWLKLVFGFRRLVQWTKLIIGNQQSSTSLGEGHFKIVGSLEADSERIYWYSCKGFLVVPKVNLQSVIKPSGAFLRFIVLVLKDWLWHRLNSPIHFSYMRFYWRYWGWAWFSPSLTRCISTAVRGTPLADMLWDYNHSWSAGGV